MEVWQENFNLILSFLISSVWGFFVVSRVVRHEKRKSRTWQEWKRICRLSPFLDVFALFLVFLSINATSPQLFSRFSLDNTTHHHHDGRRGSTERLDRKRCRWWSTAAANASYTTIRHSAGDNRQYYERNRKHGSCENEQSQEEVETEVKTREKWQSYFIVTVDDAIRWWRNVN